MMQPARLKKINKKPLSIRCLILSLKNQDLITAFAAAFHNTTALSC